ncbi:recombination protein NinG [Schlegelella sp. S2-27]|uniref:Recombination protein NinG n=1 Tax=Caldimonas mangrovi TaxID=2944811 RepID=A0ABT0YVZ4_9BURK|nr:recombination protein NinG [Caldimonas mangrovi]
MKPKRCKVCRVEFVPTKPMQRVCGYDCALTLAQSERAKAEKKAAVKDRRETKAKLDAMKGVPYWTAEAQKAFNTYVRLRDAGKPCICCAQPLGEGSVGGGYDAGHYRSRGAAPHLRFDERNCHAQRKYCNQYLSGNVVGYRKGLIERIGLEEVEALEADNRVHKWTVDELKEIKARYALMAKELRDGGGS